MKHDTLQWVGRAGKAKNRSSASPKDRLSGLRLTAGREAIAERLPSDEGTPRFEAHTLRMAVRWADVFGQSLLLLFCRKERNRAPDRVRHHELYSQHFHRKNLKKHLRGTK